MDKSRNDDKNETVLLCYLSRQQDSMYACHKFKKMLIRYPCTMVFTSRRCAPYAFVNVVFTTIIEDNSCIVWLRERMNHSWSLWKSKRSKQFTNVEIKRVLFHWWRQSHASFRIQGICCAACMILEFSELCVNNFISNWCLGTLDYELDALWDERIEMSYSCI